MSEKKSGGVAARGYFFSFPLRESVQKREPKKFLEKKGRNMDFLYKVNWLHF